MGDRAMAEIKTSDGSLYVYTHWGGSELPGDTKQAIKVARPRLDLDDEPYAMRIIVDQLTKNSRDSETGHGLLLKPMAEDEYNGDSPSVVIDLIEKQLTIIRDGTKEQYKFQEL